MLATQELESKALALHSIFILIVVLWGLSDFSKNSFCYVTARL